MQPLKTLEHNIKIYAVQNMIYKYKNVLKHVQVDKHLHAVFP